MVKYCFVSFTHPLTGSPPGTFLMYKSGAVVGWKNVILSPTFLVLKCFCPMLGAQLKSVAWFSLSVPRVDPIDPLLKVWASLKKFFSAAGIGNQSQPPVLYTLELLGCGSRDYDI